MTLPPTPDDTLNNAPFSDLMRILLGQFKRLLADNDVSLTADEILAISKAIAKHEAHPKLSFIHDVMATLVNDSLALLQSRWSLTYLRSLYADMNDIDNWETTAEFLEIANEKSNAELRISAGSSLLVAMGDTSFAPYLLDVIRHDNGLMDVDAVFAKRALLHISPIQADADDWFQQVQGWLEQQ